MTFFLRPHLYLLHFLLFLLNLHSISSYTFPLNCKDTARVCTSFLAFKPQPNQTLAIVQSMFDVLPKDITVEGNGRDYLFIRKNCSCAAGTNKYISSTTYTVKSNEGLVYDLVMKTYDGLGFLPKTTRRAENGAVITLKLFCGCSSGPWNYMMSYVMRESDSIESLASRFGVSMDNIETVNGINNPDNTTVGSLYYIPLNSVPGEPYTQKNDASAAPVPEPAPSIDNVSASQVSHAHAPYVWIVGGLGIGLVLIMLCIILYFCVRSFHCFAEARTSHEKDDEGKISHKFHVLQNPSFCCGSGRYIQGKPVEQGQYDRESRNNQITAPKVSTLGIGVFEVESPVVFTHEEILSATDGFSDSNLLGHGTYGSVYHGFIRDQDVAIKRMTATKTKEFLSAMKVLGKAHHANLVELIGYTASHDELFLIYEYAQKGSLGSHLHDPLTKGSSSLSWIMRVQIALDAARGVEYIHEHTKTNYVHRDIKSSNILLDASFRGKISDFGLAKLVGKANEEEITASKVVGTYGYLAPEYLSNGCATTKSDVYAFGIVLFEIISGKEATIPTEDAMSKNPQRRSLVSIMLAALRNSPDSMSMSSLRNHIDPNMMDLYPHDCVFKMAMLAKQCVDEDPILRPDMKQVVISLSQILLSSIEWEATLAGNSQVFSGLVQGR